MCKSFFLCARCYESWISLEGLMLKLKLQYFGHLMWRAWWWRDWRQEEKGVTEDEMVGWYHRLSGHEFEQTLGDGEGREAWGAPVHEVPKSRTWLSNQKTSTIIPAWQMLTHKQPCYLLFILSLIINNTIIWILLIKKLRHREVKELLKVTELLSSRVRPWSWAVCLRVFWL